ncbi:hypothetical protein ACFPK9_01280 [Rubritalea spongiae]|uniref:B30.2/SPRY domain-containing protein n=1 Tax=Rubritalea spongiae TaxID=430797 RepID=A0ABW5E2G6_9BACT
MLNRQRPFVRQEGLGFDLSLPSGFGLGLGGDVDPILAYDLSLYLNGSRGKFTAGDVPANGGQVATWVDLLGSGDNATQTVGANQPLDEGDSLYFNGAGDHMDLSLSNGVSFTYMVDVEILDATAIRYFGRVYTAGGHFRLGWNAGNLYCYDSLGELTGHMGAAIPLNERAVVGCTYDAEDNLFTWYKNGVAYNTITPSSTLGIYDSAMLSSSSTDPENKQYNVLSASRALTAAEMLEISNLLLP